MISTEFKALRDIDTATLELRERNAARFEEMKKLLGERYVLHPSNAPLKKKYTPVLS